MSATVHAFDFLAGDISSVPPVCVLFGDEAFLKRLARQKIRARLLGADEEIPFASLEGAEAEWRDVADELATVSLFGKGQRLAVVLDADSFVTRFRSQLENYVEHPKKSGVLVLEVEKWASNTRLYKAIQQRGLQVDCRLPQKSAGSKAVVDEKRLRHWVEEWGEAQHQVRLDSQACALLVELVQGNLGRLDQELAKLALLAPERGKVGVQLVESVVGGWRTKTIWDIVDAAAEGKVAEALQQLDRVLHAGEVPQALFGQISWSLRRFTVATRLVQQAERRRERISLRQAVEQAGFRNWPADALSRAEQQLKQLGRDRAGKLLDWLVDADLALKGSHSTPERSRFVLEQLFLRMARRGG